MQTAKEFNPRKSTFARVGLLVYVLLIAYASLYPFMGWRNNGVPPTEFLSAPLPHYWTGFDVVTNILGYAPLGLLCAFALYPRIRGIGAIALALVAGIVLSGSMEAVQTFLPNRVPSNLDLFTNSAGALIGAIAGVWLTPTFLEQSAFLRLRRRWFAHEAGRGLIVLGLWPLAQIYPQSYLFGHGQLTPIFSDWLSSLWDMPVDLAAFLRHDIEPSIEQYWLSEAIIAGCGMNGALLTLFILLKRQAPHFTLAFALLALTIAAKSLASALLFAPVNAFTWITPGAQGGLLFGAAMLAGLVFAPPAAQRRIAVAMLVIGLFIANAIPPNPYFTATMQTWLQGKFLNFNGAAQFLSLMWPFLALWFLLHPTHRKKHLVP
ncbi:MAG: VanZ family protein [Burkholderiales bacterium]|nr:VanZ family protein [Burkholderiales bacterium]